MEQNPSKSQQSPMQRETQAFIRQLQAAERYAAQGKFPQAFSNLFDALRSQAAILGVFMHTLNLTVPEVKALSEAVIALQQSKNSSDRELLITFSGLSPQTQLEYLETLRVVQAEESDSTE